MSGKCNPEQNDPPDPFLTSILVPDGLKSMIWAKCSAMGETWFLKALAQEPWLYIDIQFGTP